MFQVMLKARKERDISKAQKNIFSLTEGCITTTVLECSRS